MLERVTQHYKGRIDLLSETESLMLEQPDGRLIRERLKSEDGNISARHFGNGARVTVIALIGGLIGLSYVAMHHLSEYLMEFFIHHRHYDPKISFLAPMVRSIVFSIPLTVCAGMLVFYEPAAGGPGMPELMSYLNGSKPKANVNIRVLLIKLIGITAIVAAGLKSGYDGPFAHYGLIMAILIVNAVKTALKNGGRFWADPPPDSLPETHQDNLIFGVAGAAAAVSAAFSAPLGGVLFALEEAMSFFAPTLIFQTLCAASFAYFCKAIPKLLMQQADALSLDNLSWLHLDSRCQFPFPMVHLITFPLLGILVGGAGYIFNSMVMVVMKFKQRYLLNRPFLRLAEIALVCVLTAVIDHGVPELLDECVPYSRLFNHMNAVAEVCPITCDDTAKLFKNNPNCHAAICLPDQVREELSHELSPLILNARLECEANPLFVKKLNATGIDRYYEPEFFVIHDEENRCYFPLRTLFWALPNHTLDALFARGRHQFFTARDLAIYGICYVFLALITYYIMLPSDLVVPSLIIGGVLGRLCGLAINAVLQPMGFLPSDPGAFAILAAMTFWASSSQMVVAVAVIAIESTLDLNILPALIMCIAVAQIVSRHFGHSQYHREIHVLGFPFLSHTPADEFSKLSAKDLMVREFECVGVVDSVARIRSLLDSTVYHGFPVIKSHDAIRRYSGTSTMSETITLSGSGEKVVGFVYRKQLENALLELNGFKDVESTKTKESGDATISLADFMISPPISIKPDMLASKAFVLFRRMGLHHLMVVDEGDLAVGMLTRNEFIEKHD